MKILISTLISILPCIQFDTPQALQWSIHRTRAMVSSSSRVRYVPPVECQASGPAEVIPSGIEFHQLVGSHPSSSLVVLPSSVVAIMLVHCSARGLGSRLTSFEAKLKRISSRECVLALWFVEVSTSSSLILYVFVLGEGTSLGANVLILERASACSQACAPSDICVPVLGHALYTIFLGHGRVHLWHRPPGTYVLGNMRHCELMPAGLHCRSSSGSRCRVCIVHPWGAYVILWTHALSRVYCTSLR